MPACLGESSGYVSLCAANQEGLRSIYVPDLAVRACAVCVSCLVADKDDMQQQRDIHQERASRDPLTGLLNKVAFLEEITDLRQKGPVAYVVLDAREFGMVNNYLGHMAGDAMIKIIGQNIVESLRDDDAVAGRIGGDEFAVVTSLVPRENFTLDNRQRATVLGNRIQTSITANSDVQRYNRLFNARLGIRYGTFIDDSGVVDPELGLNNADPKGENFGSKFFSGEAITIDRRFSDISPHEVFAAFLDTKERQLTD